MIKRIVALILCVLMTCALAACGGSEIPSTSSAEASVGDSSATASKDDGKKYEYVKLERTTAPIMRFVLISDTHNNNEVFKNSIISTYNYAKTQEYNKVDAVVVVGDISNSGTEEELEGFKTAFDEAVAAIGGDTKLIACMGNHDFGNKEHSNDENKAYIAQFESIMGSKINETVEINGVKFLPMSPSNHGGDYTTALSWASSEVLAEKEKPIFILRHYQLPNTVYQSDDAEDKQNFKQYIAGCKNVTVLTGHSHAPISNRASLYQQDGGFTAYNTGSFSETNAFVDDTQGSGNYQSRQFSIVEVYADNTYDIKLYDLEKNDFMGITYQVGGKVNNSVECMSKVSGKPQFAADAKATVDKVGATAVQISFPQATDDEAVDRYRVEVRDASGAVASSAYVTSYYFKFEQAPKSLSQTVIDLKENTEYTAAVIAVDFYGVESEALVTEKFTTKSYVSGVSTVFEDALTSGAKWSGKVDSINDKDGFFIKSQGSGYAITSNESFSLGNKWLVSADYFRANYNTSDSSGNFSAIQVGDLTAVIQRGPNSDNMYLCYGYNASGNGTAIADNYIVAKVSLSATRGEINIAMSYENGVVNVYRDGFAAITVSADELKAKAGSLPSFDGAKLTLRLNDAWVVQKATFKNVVLKK